MPSLQNEPWSSFEEILERLHRGGVYIHAEQLAKFLLMHGLPVDLCYVEDGDRSKAEQVNLNYNGDMARLENLPSYSHAAIAGWSLESLPQATEIVCN